MRKQFTILTAPVIEKSKFEKIRECILGKKDKAFGGHPARTRRIVEGFEKMGFTDFNYQPDSIDEIGEHVHVMAGVEALRFAIELKKQGKIKKLTAGPNIVVFSDEYDSLIADEAIDMYLQPSEWAADMHIKIEPRLKGRCVWFPLGGVGINTETFKPKACDRRGHVLLYHKGEGPQIIYRVKKLLNDYGYECEIIRAGIQGSYKFEDYIEALNRSEFMVAVGRQEASGNYLTEAWAMDTPTVCFEPHYYHWFEPYDFEYGDNISNCPYLTEFTGATFYEMHELEDIIKNIDSYKEKWAPRKWVKENMSVERCSRMFLDTIGVDYSK